MSASAVAVIAATAFCPVISTLAGSSARPAAVLLRAGYTGDDDDGKAIFKPYQPGEEDAVEVSAASKRLFALVLGLPVLAILGGIATYNPSDEELRGEQLRKASRLRGGALLPCVSSAARTAVAARARVTCSPRAAVPDGLTENAVWGCDADALDELISTLSAEATPSSRRLLAIALARRGDTGEAEAQAKLALESDDADDAAMLFLVGLAAEKRGDLEEAVDAYAEALELDAQSWRAHFHLAKLFLNAGMVSSAAECLQATLAANPDFAPAQAAMARLEGVDVEALQRTFDESLDEMVYGDGPGLPEPAPGAFNVSSLGALFVEVEED